MNFVTILITLVIFGIFLALLYRILKKILPMLGVDEDWISIVFGIIGLICLIMVLDMIGFGPGWVRFR